jgi:hypothetical protein
MITEDGWVCLLDGKKTTGLGDLDVDIKIIDLYSKPKIYHKTDGIKESVLLMRESGLSFEEIGEEFGFSRQRAHQIYKTNRRL